MTDAVQIVTLIFTIFNALGVGKIIHWVITVETRMMRIETICEQREKTICEAEGK
jgi:hypothetical protein